MIGAGATVLALAPHADDAEFGCGASLSRLVREGATIHYLVLSICEDSVPAEFPKDVMAGEVLEAASLLGVAETNVMVHRYPVRRLSEHRHAILDIMVELRNRLRPAVVFAPSSDDVHQDHQVVSVESRRAFKHATILGYELPWNSFRFAATCSFKVTDADVAAKVSACAAYRSQAHRAYGSGEWAYHLAKIRGLQGGLELAEAFEVGRLNL